jgi:hypothetical protein
MAAREHLNLQATEWLANAGNQGWLAHFHATAHMLEADSTRTRHPYPTPLLSLPGRQSLLALLLDYLVELRPLACVRE